MSKSIKKMLVAGTSLLMFISVGTNINNVQAKRYHHICTHRTYRYSGWYKGTPNVFHQHSYWVSNYLNDKYSKTYPYSRFVFPMNKNKGINLFNIGYKNKHSKGLPGSDTSAFAENYPYYKNLGHGKYLITCGDSNISHKHGHLYYDLENNVYLVKMHGHKHLSLRLCNTNSRHHHKNYVGYYTKHAYSSKRINKMLKAKEF